MVRKLIILATIAFFAICTYALLIRKQSHITPQTLENAESPQIIVIERFQSFRFEGTSLIGGLAADEGRVYSPNILKLKGHVQGFEKRQEQEKHVACRESTILFESKQAGDLLNNPTPLTAEVESEVTLSSGEFSLKNQKSHYDFKTGVAYATIPTVIIGVAKNMHATDGFVYNTRDETFELKGQVTGEYVSPKKAHP